MPLNHKTLSRPFTIPNELGFHARPAALFVGAIKDLNCEVGVQMGRTKIDGKSIIDLLTLGAERGTQVTIHATGKDAPQAMAAIAALFARNLGD